MADTDTNGWLEYKHAVLNRLDEQREDIKLLQKSVNELSSNVSALNVKAGIWGMAGGILAGIVGMFYRGKT